MSNGKSHEQKTTSAKTETHPTGVRHTLLKRGGLVGRDGRARDGREENTERGGEDGEARHLVETVERQGEPKEGRRASADDWRCQKVRRANPLEDNVSSSWAFMHWHSLSPHACWPKNYVLRSRPDR